MVRFKNRYLLCVLEHDGDGDGNPFEKVTVGNILGAVKESIQVNFGDVGVGTLNASLAIKYWSAPLSMVLIRAARDHYQLVWASLAMITELSGLPVTICFRVIHVGGTIRSCQKTAIEHARRVILSSADAEKGRESKHRLQFEQEKALFAAIKEERT